MANLTSTVILKVLIIEDSEDDALLIVRALKKSGYRIEYRQEETGEAMSAALKNEQWHVIISDYSMPHFSGLDALRILKETGQDIPFIIVSGTIGEESAVLAMKAGAHDYLMKDNLIRLMPAIERELREADERHARKTAEEQVFKLSSALMQSASIVVITDIEGRVEYINDSFTRISGYNADDVVGQLIDLRHPNSEQNIVGRLLDNVIKSGGEWRGELLNQKKNRDHYWVLVTASAIRSRDGQITNFLFIQEDISQRKVLEDQLTHYAEELERIVEERTAQLRQEKERAEIANRTKSEFLANMSHEIRTPLNGVIGITELLLTTELSDMQQDYVHTILQGSDALLNIINEILDFSKIEAGKVTLDPHGFSPVDCIESAIGLLTPRAAEKGLTLSYYVDSTVPYQIIGDSSRLRQILVNLLSNAVKFTEKGEISVQASASVIGGVHEMLFIVKDTGIGIPAEHHQRIFQAFDQVDASTSRIYGGTGLGLAICKRLVEMMGGTIWLDSAVNKGTTFYFTINFEISAEPIQERTVQAASVAARHILIVESNPTYIEMLRQSVENWHFTPHIIQSSADTASIINSGLDYGAVILDAATLGSSLTPMVDLLRLKNAHLPIIILLSTDDPTHHKMDGVTYFAKPLKLSKLFEALNESHLDKMPIRFRPQRPTTASEKLDVKLPTRILLAEDNLVNQEVALRMLHYMGYQAEVATNGIEVLEALAHTHFDIILMDIQMPRMDGIEAADQIFKRYPANTRPKIIAVTAHALQGDREKYLALGMDDYISKPIKLEELIAAVKRADPLAQMMDNLIDLEDAKRRMGNHAASMIAELLPLFRQEAPRLIQSARNALAQYDAETLSRTAHTLRGSSATVGARTVAELCLQLEKCSKAGDLESAEMIFWQIEALLEEGGLQTDLSA